MEGEGPEAVPLFNESGSGSLSADWEKVGEASVLDTPPTTADAWNSSAFLPLETRFKRQTELVIGSFFMVFALLGSLGNGLTIFVLCRARRLYNPCTPFLVNMSVADLCMTMFVLAPMGANALAGKVLTPYPICKLLSVFFHTLITTSWICLMVLSGFRCHGVWFPNRKVAPAWTASLIALSWLLPHSWIPAFLWDVWDTKGHTAQVCAFFCGVKAMEPWKEEAGGRGLNISQSGEDDALVTAVPTILLLCSATPFLLSFLFYALIFIKMRESKNTLRDLEVAAFNKHLREERFTRMMALIFGSMTVCCLIPMTYYIAESVRRAGISNVYYLDDDHEIMAIVSNISLFIPSVSNPIIYVLSNPNYRRAYKAMLCPRLLLAEEAPKSEKHTVRGPLLGYRLRVTTVGGAGACGMADQATGAIEMAAVASVCGGCGGCSSGNSASGGGGGDLAVVGFRQRSSSAWSCRRPCPECAKPNSARF